MRTITRLLLTLLVCAAMTGCTGSDQTSTTSDSPAAGISLTLQVIDYPRTITSRWQDVALTLSAKNTGDQTLHFSDIQDEADGYRFAFYEDDILFVATTADVQVDDFGAIAPSEVKTMTLRSVSKTLNYKFGASGMFATNNFDRFYDKNGTHTFELEFQHITSIEGTTISYDKLGQTEIAFDVQLPMTE